MRSKKDIKIPLDKYINLSLYDKKNGYYMKKNPFGDQGDFTTAPNISRLFSEMIAIWIISFWQSLGCPKKFNLIELGAGNAEMMKIIIESFQNFPSFLNSCNFLILEKSPSLIEIQRKKLNEHKIRIVHNAHSQGYSRRMGQFSNEGADSSNNSNPNTSHYSTGFAMTMYEYSSTSASVTSVS